MQMTNVPSNRATQLRLPSCPACLTRPAAWSALGVMLAALAAYLPTLAPTITWSHGGADSGDLAAAVATLGIAHPPGYPTYVLLGYAWSWLPLGDDLAYRLNLLSALSAALAAGLTTAIIMTLGRRRSPALLPLAFGAGTGGLLLALAPITWSQAIITEVYAPGLAAVAWLSWLLFRSMDNRRRRPLFFAGVVGGLGLGLLPQLALAAPGALLLLWDLEGRSRLHSTELWQRLASLLLGTALGLSIFAYLPLRALAQPLVNWGDPTTPARFWALITADVYHPYLALLTPGQWLGRLADTLFQLKQALSGSGLALTALGGYTLWCTHRPALLYLLSLAGLTVLFRTSYPALGNLAYLLPVLFCLALLAGVGTARLLALAHTHLGRGGAVLLGLSFLITLGLRAALIAPQLDLSADDGAARFGQQVMAWLPPQAVVISNQDETTFSLWYRLASGDRADVVVIDQRLLARPWYRHHLEQRYPFLDLTSELSASNRPVFVVKDRPGEEPGLKPVIEKQDTKHDQ